ncbi:hypothetical protein Glove_279g47 [Diversispora epigaea]|uniref:C2H2-type domain-containing protein n=1 Tax=Diversispora epigaea TaxID=1348612 RepID=A0A397I298_9GLOM|nr:hypothetical protein Glove_279g47 [Diversispora epigaea]
MPSTILPDAEYITCGKVFKNSKDLTRHKQYVRRYNLRHQGLDELPANTIAEFKQILITEIHKKLSLNFRSMGKKLVSLPCPESIFFSVFGGYIYYYSSAKGIYKCIFRGCDSYHVLSTILNSNHWGKKVYSQNQQTYVVCLNNSPQNLSIIEEIDPLEQLLQSSMKHKKINRRPRFLRGEILIEWKKRTFKEINGIVNTAGYLNFDFYIAQSCSY